MSLTGYPATSRRRFCLPSKQAHGVSLRTDRRNERSRAAIERLGARLDGVVRAAQMAYDGSIRDSAVYSILDSEWPDVKVRLAARLRS